MSEWAKTGLLTHAAGAKSGNHLIFARPATFTAPGATIRGEPGFSVPDAEDATLAICRRSTAGTTERARRIGHRVIAGELGKLIVGDGHRRPPVSASCAAHDHDSADGQIRAYYPRLRFRGGVPFSWRSVRHPAGRSFRGSSRGIAAAPSLYVLIWWLTPRDVRRATRRNDACACRGADH